MHYALCACMYTLYSMIMCINHSLSYVRMWFDPHSVPLLQDSHSCSYPQCYSRCLSSHQSLEHTHYRLYEQDEWRGFIGHVIIVSCTDTGLAI